MTRISIPDGELDVRRSVLQAPADPAASTAEFRLAAHVLKLPIERELETTAEESYVWSYPWSIILVFSRTQKIG